MPAREIVESISQTRPLEAIDAAYRGEVAQRWRYVDGGGEIGVIASVTQPFCGDCTRARLSADGKFFTCLFAASGVDMRAQLRSDMSDVELDALIDSSWRVRGDRYSEIRSQSTAPRARIEMSYIGG